MALAIGWILTGLVIVVAGLLAGRSRRALTVGLGATAFAMAGLGAVGNAVLVATGVDFSAYADASYSGAVRDTLGAAASAQISVFVALLIAYQATAGLVILFGGRWVEVGLAATIGLQLGLLAFGWWYFLVSPVLILGLVLLWRAWRRAATGPLDVPDILEAREHDRRS
ncbi:MAG TPA: hypothetical protein VIT41_15010 [Microlunatus sp.]